ncbi:MAG: M14 family zinc carboxypeptidase [Gemmatimonadales bacterium]|jgi:hypothetical protein
MDDPSLVQRFDQMEDRSAAILHGPQPPATLGSIVGHSREGREIRAFKIGAGPRRISLLAGCHADEPVGPRLLRRLSHYLSGLAVDDPLLADYQWWIVPHINPDGAVRNKRWQPSNAKTYDLADYLLHAVRELPGDDIEFGFPLDLDDADARPENRAVYSWWRSAAGPFHLHVSLHGMAFGAGPWFLIEEAWKDRVTRLKRRCLQRVAELGYVPHDVDRRGEKGFSRLDRGFCTRPDSRYMRAHFLGLGDVQTAGKFRPSSMETIRGFGDDPLTLVSEMPLFITPDVGETLDPRDPVAEMWKERIAVWKAGLQAGASPADVSAEAAAAGVAPMPVEDQMKLQWTLIVAGLEACSL